MKSLATWGFVAFPGCICGSARAASIVDAKPDAGAYDSSIVLHDSAAGTVNVGTSWFAWIPGQDHPTTSPGAVASVPTSSVDERDPFQAEAVRFVATATREPSSPTPAGVGAVLGALGLRRVGGASAGEGP